MLINMGKSSTYTLYNRKTSHIVLYLNDAYMFIRCNSMYFILKFMLRFTLCDKLQSVVSYVIKLLY